MTALLNVTRRTALAGLAASMATMATAKVASAAASPRSRTVVADWSKIELRDTLDHSFRPGDVDKPLTLMIVWASWCAACMKQLPTIANIATALGETKVDVVMVSHPDDWRRDHEIIRDHGLNVRCARPTEANGDEQIYRAFVSDDGVFYVPRTMVYRRQSQAVVWNHVGGLDWNHPGTIEPIRKWLV